MSACCPTCKRRLPVKRVKAENRHVAAFLKMGFVSYADRHARAFSVRVPNREISPEARAQFAYGGRDRKAKDAAVLYAAAFREPVAV